MLFTVIDNATGQEPDTEEIALHEEWAKGLIYCDMEGFAIMDDGTLILMDECGGFVECPEGRFTVSPDIPKLLAERDELKAAIWEIGHNFILINRIPEKAMATVRRVLLSMLPLDEE